MYSTVQILPKVMCLLRSARIPPKSFSFSLRIPLQYCTVLDSQISESGSTGAGLRMAQHTDIVCVQYMMDSYILEIRLRQIVAS